jgi:hypothetical protein
MGVREEGKPGGMVVNKQKYMHMKYCMWNERAMAEVVSWGGECVLVGVMGWFGIC